MTEFKWPVNVLKHSPESAFHNLILFRTTNYRNTKLSSEPFKTQLLECFSMLYTQWVWPFNILIQSPNSTSQIRIDLSKKQLTILLLDSIAILNTASEWPKSFLIQSPVALSQILIDLSSEQLTIWFSLNASDQFRSKS